MVGFILGCLNTSGAMKAAILRAWLPLALTASLGCIRRPSLIRRVIETFRYPRRLGVPGPELLVMAVAPEARDRGIGTQLLTSFNQALRAMGIDRYHVSVKAANTIANRFYSSRAFVLIHQIHMYDEPWNIYECPLALDVTSR